jgi:outer membrane protein insertion porin family
VSGTVTAYRSVARYYLADLGRSIRTGAQVQLGLPVPQDRASRLFVSYGGEAVEFGTGGLLGETQDEFGTSFRSTLGLSLTRDTRSILPFATAGSMYSLSAQFNGGPLGGTSAFQRYNAEARAYAPLGTIGGGSQPGQQPMQFTVGLTTRAGAVFGNTGPFFFSQEFALGGVQYGEQLRGYDEFSITPFGFVDTDGSSGATRNSFGKAFFTATAEAGLRVNQSLYLSLFYDAGNVWRNPKEIDPSRLFRGAGISASVVSPLGPLGLDYAYGFDRVDANGRRNPKWQLHFRLGQLF